MSLILEALRKSETERRLGDPPGLMSISAVSTVYRRRSRLSRWLWLLSGVVLVVAVIGAWDRWRLLFSPSNIVSSPVDRVGPVAIDANSPSALAQIDAIPAVTHGRPVSADSKIGAPRHTSADIAATAPVANSAPIPVAQTQRDPSQAAAVVPPLPPPTAVAMSAAPTAVAAKVDLPLPALLRVDQLPAAERQALPPLKVSMHVYSENPAARVVLIDGKRVGEGAVLAEALSLIEIRRDGSVLDYRGQHLLLPRP